MQMCTDTEIIIRLPLATTGSVALPSVKENSTVMAGSEQWRYDGDMEGDVPPSRSLCLGAPPPENLQFAAEMRR